MIVPLVSRVPGRCGFGRLRPAFWPAGVPAGRSRARQSGAGSKKALQWALWMAIALMLTLVSAVDNGARVAMADGGAPATAENDAARSGASQGKAALARLPSAKPDLPAADAPAAFVAPASLADDGSRTAYVLVSAKSWLNVRERPAAHAAITLRLTRGDALTVYHIDSAGWAEVSRAGDPGFCRARYLCDTPPGEPLPCVTTAGKVNLRAAPSGKAVGRLSCGQAVTVLGTLTDDQGDCWALLANGFVRARYLSPAP